MEAMDLLLKAARKYHVADVTDHSADDLTRQQLALHSHKSCVQENTFFICQTPFITSGSILIATTFCSIGEKTPGYLDSPTT